MEQTKRKGKGLAIAAIVLLAMSLIMKGIITISGIVSFAMSSVSFKYYLQQIPGIVLFLMVAAALIVFTALSGKRGGKWCMLVVMVLIIVQSVSQLVGSISNVYFCGRILFREFVWSDWVTWYYLLQLISHSGWAIASVLTVLLIIVGIILLLTNRSVRGIMIAVSVCGIVATLLTFGVNIATEIIKLTSSYGYYGSGAVGTSISILASYGLSLCCGILFYVGMLLAGCAYTRFDKAGNMIVNSKKNVGVAQVQGETMPQAYGAPPAPNAYGAPEAVPAQPDETANARSNAEQQWRY